MITPRLVTTVSTLLVAGIAAAAIAPVLPFRQVPEPTEQHAKVVKGAGEYEGTITMMMPGSEPMQAPCTETVTAIGELWTVSHFEMEFMGQPFEGSSIFGYDPEKEKFVGTWIDSMTPKLTVMEGDWDAGKKAFVMHYEMADPMTGGTVDMRNEHVHRDDGYTSSFYSVGEDGEESLSMKIEMTRKKATEAGAAK